MKRGWNCICFGYSMFWIHESSSTILCKKSWAHVITCCTSMVANNTKMQTKRLGTMEWSASKWIPDCHGLSIIGTIRGLCHSLWYWSFYHCTDYHSKNWHHTKLDFDHYWVLQYAILFSRNLKNHVRYKSASTVVLIFLLLLESIFISCSEDSIKASKLKNIPKVCAVILTFVFYTENSCGCWLSYVTCWHWAQGETFFHSP